MTKLQATQFLKATGLLDGFEAVIETMVTNGWPGDTTIYDHAAYELLKWHSQHKEDYAGQKIVNPGTKNQVMAFELTAVKHSDKNVIDASQTTSKYPEIDQAATIEKYRQSLRTLPPLDGVERLKIKSKCSSQLQKLTTIDVSLFEQAHRKPQSNRKQQIDGSIKLQKTTTKRITVNPESTRESHVTRKFLDLKTSSYDRDREAATATMMTVDNVYVQSNINASYENTGKPNLRPNEKIKSHIRESTPVHMKGSGRISQTIEHPHVKVTITADPPSEQEQSNLQHEKYIEDDRREFQLPGDDNQDDGARGEF